MRLRNDRGNRTVGYLYDGATVRHAFQQFVEKLDAGGHRKIQHRYGGNDADTYEIKIAEEPSHSLACEKWIVYIALEFTATDKLRDLHIRKIGTCL